MPQPPANTCINFSFPQVCIAWIGEWRRTLQVIVWIRETSLVMFLTAERTLRQEARGGWGRKGTAHVARFPGRRTFPTVSAVIVNVIRQFRWFREMLKELRQIRLANTKKRKWLRNVLIFMHGRKEARAGSVRPKYVTSRNVFRKPRRSYGARDLSRELFPFMVRACLSEPQMGRQQ